MAPSRILVAAALIAGLAAPATAGAAQARAQDHRTPTHTAVSSTKAAPLKAAVAVGRRYWGAMPCGGQIRFVARSPLARGIDPTTDAWVTFGSPLGANNLDAPASSYTNCVIAFARWRWPTSASMSQDWDMLCTTMLHEMGHLLGHPHESRRGSVMAPVFADSSSVPSACRKTRPRPAR